MNRIQAISRVQKLLRLAESPNENEAALAAAHAKRILSEFNIAAIEVGEETGGIGYVKEFTVKIETYEQWIQELLNTVKIVYNCDIFIGKDLHSIVFIGEETNAKIASYVFEYLMKTINRICEEAIKKKDSGEWLDITRFIGMQGINSFRGIVNNDLFRKSYKIGAAVRVCQKLREQINVSDKEVALILVMHDAITEYVDKKHGGASEMQFEESPYDEYAAMLGEEDAGKITIHEAIEK